MATGTENRGRLDQHTGLRFFAAFLVFAVHFRWDTSPKALTDLLAQGYVGVNFFFILSGFVLTHSYKERILSGRSPSPPTVCNGSRA